MKKNKQSDAIAADTSRRQWLRVSARWAVAGLCAATVGLFYKRNGITFKQQECRDTEGRMGCRDCGVFDHCGHPRAMSVKQFLGKRQ